MRYSGGKRFPLLVLLLVGLQRNVVNTQSGDDPAAINAEARRKYAIISREQIRDLYLSQQSQPLNYPQSRVSQTLPQSIPQSYQLPVVSDALQFDERIANWISFYVSRFSQNVAVRLAETQYSKSEVFSPLSVMSALAVLMLGARGKSYEQISQIFGLDLDPELVNNPGKFHTELGYMLEDLQQLNNGVIRSRKSSEWRDTVVSHNMRNTNNNAANGDTMGHHITKIANGIFTQTGYSLNRAYRSVLNLAYHSEVMELDFERHQTEARDHINAWVAQRTNGKIPNIIKGQIPSSTNVILASALYFKGLWENPFFELATTLDNFYPDGKGTQPVKVQMMATGGTFPYYESAEYDCRIIGLPYKGNKTAMYIIQPNHSTRQKLQQFQRTLNPQKIEDLISKMIKRTAIVAFPKFHLIRNLNMRSLLIQMGITDIFASGVSDLSLIGKSPDAATQHSTYAPVPAKSSTNDRLIFSRMRSKRQVEDHHRQIKPSALQQLESQRQVVDTNSSDLFVEDIVHKVDFEINEHGTEAAAATLTYLRRSGTDVLFRNEEPFIFLVRDDPTKLILFYGYYNEPDN